MKIEITKPGVYDKDGKEIEVGTEITVAGDKVPAWLVNKGRIAAAATKKAEPITNPKKD